jgi:hypothetical protein
MTNVIKKEDLEKLPYGDFKSKFEELGISDAYKHGNKKEVYIKTILDTLSAKQELEKENLSATTKDAEALSKDKKVNSEKKEVSDKKALFNKGVKEVISKKDHWTKEKMEKRILVLTNVFLQHRDSSKGINAKNKAEIYKEALAKLYK